jgi:hypothetical protein
MFLKFISIPTFIISLAIGLFVVYLWGPETKIVYAYPTPENSGNKSYQDSLGNCFKYSAKKVQCPSFPSEVKTIPMQN